MESFTAQKRMKDMCEKYGGAGFVPLSHSLLVEMRSANTNYHKRLQNEKKQKEAECKRQREEEENNERKRKAEEEKVQWEEKHAKLKEEIKIKEGLLKGKQQAAVQHMVDMINMKDPKLMRSIASAAKLDQETIGTLSSKVLELQKMLIKLNVKKPKLSS